MGWGTQPSHPGVAVPKLGKVLWYARASAAVQMSAEDVVGRNRGCCWLDLMTLAMVLVICFLMSGPLGFVLTCHSF